MADDCERYASRSFTDEELAQALENTSTFIAKQVPAGARPNLDLLDPLARMTVEVISRAAKREESDEVTQVLDRMSAKTLKHAKHIFRITAYDLGAPTYREREVAEQVLNRELPEGKITNLWEAIRTAVSTTIRRTNYGKD